MSDVSHTGASAIDVAAAAGIGLAEARRILGLLGVSDRSAGVATMAEIVRATAAEHGVTVAELRGPDRQRRVAWPRQAAMWRMAQQKRWTLGQMGQCLGGRHHTTVLHGVRAYEARTGPRA